MISTKTQIVCGVIIAFIFAGCIFLFIVNIFVTPYISETDKLPNIVTFYDQNNNATGYKVYFVGDSQIREGIDANEVEKTFSKNNITAEVFNLGYTGDTPVRRLTELKKLIKSKPDLVIIGVSYHSFSHPEIIPREHLIMVGGTTEFDDTTKAFFTESELNVLNSNIIELSYEKRVWVAPMLISIIYQDKQIINNSHNFKNPYIYSKNQTPEELIDKLRRYPTQQVQHVTFPESENRMTESETYTIQQLKNANISVILIDMPLNPLLRPFISTDNRTRFETYLSEVGVPVIDLENQYPQSDFIDFLHLNAAGRKNLTQQISDEIIARMN